MENCLNLTFLFLPSPFSGWVNSAPSLFLLYPTPLSPFLSLPFYSFFFPGVVTALHFETIIKNAIPIAGSSSNMACT